MKEIREAITDLVANAYWMGMAAGSKGEVFLDGEIYTLDDLAERHKEKTKSLNALLDDAS